MPSVFTCLIFSAVQRMNKVPVRMLTPEQCTTFWRTSRTIPTWPSKNLFHNSLFSIKRGSTTSILSQNNKAWCNGTNKLVKIFISLHCVTSFFHVKYKHPTTAKMHKIFIAKKSYCACRVLSLATIWSKYYFNFILKRTRSGRELSDRPSYMTEDFKLTWTQKLSVISLI